MACLRTVSTGSFVVASASTELAVVARNCLSGIVSEGFLLTLAKKDGSVSRWCGTIVVVVNGETQGGAQNTLPKNLIKRLKLWRDAKDVFVGKTVLQGYNRFLTAANDTLKSDDKRPGEFIRRKGWHKEIET